MGVYNPLIVYKQIIGSMFGGVTVEEYSFILSNVQKYYMPGAYQGYK